MHFHYLLYIFIYFLFYSCCKTISSKRAGISAHFCFPVYYWLLRQSGHTRDAWWIFIKWVNDWVDISFTHIILFQPQTKLERGWGRYLFYIYRWGKLIFIRVRFHICSDNCIYWVLNIAEGHADCHSCLHLILRVILKRLYIIIPILTQLLMP